MDQNNDLFDKDNQPADNVPPQTPTPFAGAAQVYTPPPPTSTPYVPTTPPAQKSNRTIWIVVAVVVVLLLCCCCVAIGSFLYNNGDQFIQDMEDFSRIAPTLAAMI